MNRRIDDIQLEVQVLDDVMRQSIQRNPNQHRLIRLRREMLYASRTFHDALRKLNHAIADAQFEIGRDA